MKLFTLALISAVAYAAEDNTINSEVANVINNLDVQKAVGNVINSPDVQKAEDNNSEVANVINNPDAQKAVGNAINSPDVQKTVEGAAEVQAANVAGKTNSADSDSTTPLKTSEEANQTSIEKNTTRKVPTITSRSTNAANLTTLGLSLYWEKDCMVAEKPSIKVSIDKESAAGGAALSADPNPGFTIQASASGNVTVLSGNQTTANYTSLTYAAEEDVVKGDFTINFLYLAQRAVRSNTSFDVELKCGNASYNFTKAQNSAVPLMINSAAKAKFTFAAISAIAASLLFSL